MSKYYQEEDCMCPILMENIENPVLLSDGIIYEETMLNEWLKKRNKSPKTGLFLENKNTVKPVFFEKLLKNLEFDINDFICPLTKKVFLEPVISFDDGYCYEKKYLEKWNKTFETSAMTGKPLSVKLYHKCVLFNNIFENYKEDPNSIPVINNIGMYGIERFEGVKGFDEQKYIKIIFNNSFEYDGKTIDAKKVDIVNVINNIRNTAMLKYLIDHLSDINHIFKLNYDSNALNDLDDLDDFDELENDLPSQLIFILLEYKADVSIIYHIFKHPDFDYNVESPIEKILLHYICLDSNRLNIEFVKNVIDKINDLNTFDNRNRRAIDYLRLMFKEDNQLIQYIISKGACPYTNSIYFIGPKKPDHTKKLFGFTSL
jgi:hypothetical protein